MSFSKEDRREVYDFFENLLLKADRPIYFEHLRGNVVKASPAVKRYVTKKCKGENLLKYFETRKNYFDVSLKQEVSLKKSRCRLLSYKSEFDETEEANKDEKLNDDENSDSEVNFEDLEYSCGCRNSRCYSTASDITADIESVEEYATSRYKLTHKEELRSDYEELTNKYFCRYLSRHGRVEISQIEVENLPKKVKRYIKNYIHNKLLLFFKSNSECYLVEEDKYVSLILSSVIKDTSQKNADYVEDSPVIVDMIDESFDDSNAETQTVDNFLSCVEFFVGILKKKSCVPLKNISGSLSQAPSSILTYLKSNYGNYKDFLHFVPCLFAVNEREEVSLTKECYTLLKRAKKLLRLKSNAEFWSQPIENIICSLFTTEVHPKNKNSSLENEEPNSINEQQLEDPVMSSSNEADVCSARDIDSYCKISGVDEKLNASEKEVLKFWRKRSFESSNDCGNVIQKVHSEITLDKAAKETPLKLENTTAYLASDLKNCGPKRDTKLSNNTKASMNNQEKIEIQSDVELEMKSALEPISVLDGENIKVPVNPASDTFLENDDNSCILSNDTAMKKQTSRHFIECAFNTQLLCLEIIEREKNLTLSFEYEAVKYFVEILESSASLYSHGKTADVNVLKGKIGQASVGVKLFFKQFYKGEKIVLFFQKYDEFILDSHTSWIKLSPHYEKSLENRRIENENFNKGIKIFRVHSLYNSYFHNVVAEVFDCLFKICKSLHKSTKMKFNRLCGKFLHLSSIQQNFFNSLSGSEITEKLEKFLLHFNKLFYFNDIYIQINPELNILFLVNCMSEFNKQLKLSSEFKSPYFHHLSDFIACETLPLDFEEMKKVTIERVQDFFSYTSCFNYSDLPNIVEHEVLHSLILEGKDSQCLIKLLEDCELFELKDGKIFLKKDNSEQVIDNFTSYDELSNSNLHITDTYSNDSTLHKESTEQEHINEVHFGLNKNISSQHQNTDIIESNNKSCTDNMGVEDSLEDNNKNSKHFSENSSSFCKTDKVEKSISDPEIDCIDEGNKGDEKAISRLSSSAFLKDSCPKDSNYDSLSCIKKTACLNDEKSVEGDSLINSITSGLQALVINERENENNSEFNLDKSKNEGVMGIKAAENLTNSRVLDLKEVSSEKRNKSPEGPAITVNHAVEFNTSENLKSNKISGANNLEKFSIKGNYVGVSQELSEAVKNESRLGKTISKFMSEPNLSSEECVDSESPKLCDGALTLNSVKHSNGLLYPNKSYENFANTTAASNSKTFEVNYEESLNSGKCLDRDTIEISSMCDDKSLKVAKTTHFIPNDEFENNKGNFDDKIVLNSSASDSNVSKNNEDVTKFEEKDEICTDENYFKLGKITENLNENSPREKLPACLISKNRFFVNLFQDVKNKEEGNSKLSEATIEDTSGNDKENIEKNKLNISTCLNTENTVNSLGRNKTKSTTKDVHATLKNKAEFKEITNEDSPCLNDLKRKSKNACINQILKSNNVDTEVDIGDCVKDCSKERLLQADNEAGISKGVLREFKDGTDINKSLFPSIVPEHSKFDPKVSELACNKTTDNKFLLKKEPRKISNAAFSWVKNLPEKSVIESKSDLTTDLKSSDAPISDSHCHSAQTKVKETHSNFLSSNYKLPEIEELKPNVDENCSSDLSNQNLNLQPLQCKVIVLTVDSCIVETVINGCRKYIFCLKSSFFCDEHIDCLCFNNLIVGDSVQCYIPPGTGFDNGNMCIAFMMCHNSNASEVKSDFSPQMPNKELPLDNSKSFFKKFSSTIPNYLSLKQMPIHHKMSECQTDISGEIKRCSSVAVKKCQTKCLTVSKSTQAKYEERKHDSCDKSFQTQVSTALQSTQTIYKSTENECQTIFSGKVKPCFFTDEKACQVQCANNSFGTQTSCKYSDKGSQTCSNTPALTSSKSNTDLSGPVRKCVCLSDKSSQVSSLSSLVCQTTQTVPENAIDLKSRLLNLCCDQQLNVNVQNVSVRDRSALTAERAYPMCDAACQTASTGPIMIKRYYM